MRRGDENPSLDVRKIRTWEGNSYEMNRFIQDCKNINRVMFLMERIHEN